MHMSEITIAYGMTETSPVSFQSSRDDPLELRVSTVGRYSPISRSRSSTVTAASSRAAKRGALHQGILPSCSLLG